VQELGVETETRGLSATGDIVCQKLCERLARLISPAGSRAMLSRALHLARPEFLFLERVRVGREGFEGLEQALRDVEASAADHALLTVSTSLIDLLVGVIGEELTLALVAEVLPDLPLREPLQPDTFDGQVAAS
jgi:hypothetical protein